ncbi:ATP-dependent DNA helicase [Magnetospira sp. QH-2]|uniref:ATP-dependent DNA helicase n=1 Tax=Magnetospira sp. (strain QH-2) TaxID=1288970 RepID=UPI0003E80C31|nr:ATP-dependent DNA helicase [Magnetospira sp. QH-2]CCQ72353.1 putative Rad3-related DNA helicases [Magnetospira sp. QH-2]
MTGNADSLLRLPQLPALAVGLRGVAWGMPGEEPESLGLHEAARRIHDRGPVLVCHAPAAARRLKTASFPALDLLELFAFVRPACFCLPTPAGLAGALDLPPPTTLAEEAALLHQAALTLLSNLSRGDPGRDAGPVAWAMTRGNWAWAPYVLPALGESGDLPHSRNLSEGLKVWTRRADWSEHAPEPPAGHLPVEPVEARAQLVKLLGNSAEDRPQQKDYAAAVATAFDPCDAEGEPSVVLAEAGTGVGKTLGYIAPAAVWARKNHGPVWISTYTRNLQRQLDGELDRLYPDRGEKIAKAVVRKGRENYLCLLNLDEAVQRLPLRPADAVGLGLMARWGAATRDGDMVGGDFPGWLADLVGRRLTMDLTDTRGECLYSGCIHYRKCYVERSIRRARRAEIVVANHALVMVQAALGGGDEAYLPTRYVFDEGHHLFDAADKAFAAHLSGFEGAELRRWLLGAEDRDRSRARGLKARMEDLVAAQPDLLEALEGLLKAAHILPGLGWHQRLSSGQPHGVAEKFLERVRAQVYARAKGSNSAYSLEAETQPPIPGLIETAVDLERDLKELETPARGLIRALAKLMDDEAADLDSQARQRIDVLIRSLERRCVDPAQAWRAMLRALGEETPPEYVDWLSVDRQAGRDVDVGLHRHWVDPVRPFAQVLSQQAQGFVITSATLRDGTGDVDTDWSAAETRTGTRHLLKAAERAAVASPFDYAAQTRVLVVNDLGREDMDLIASAYRELFLAAHGGGLGLFTAISRLRAVHGKIAGPLDQAGLPLYAQHVDALDTGTLIDIFRAEENACLLGTDAVRDGVDVPGNSLRLIVFDRVPWARADLLHKARRKAFGGGRYDDMLTRLKLKQAYGRLVRRADDRGVFVMLDSRLPSRLLGAFPEGVEVQRIGLAEAVDLTRAFLSQK